MCAYVRVANRGAMILRSTALTTSFALGAAWAGEAEQLEFFESKIRPLLAENCYACHTNTKMGGLRLDSRESAVRGGNSGPAIRPGNAAGSLLIQVVRHEHDRLKMPLSGERLDNKKIEALKAWIQDGAAWPDEDIIPQATESTKYEITLQQQAFWSFHQRSFRTWGSNSRSPHRWLGGTSFVAMVQTAYCRKLHHLGEFGTLHFPLDWSILLQPQVCP